MERNLTTISSLLNLDPETTMALQDLTSLSLGRFDGINYTNIFFLAGFNQTNAELAH
jgi:hypothetical protein